ncbi:conserved hypothetical protein [Trichinella spiralis]|uniref:hypothetical protein n=1 Tax=Trichinella spiralis TaxID=6334 RepID=UPI0001EFBB5D|nr:conserved hypothetical protein [Trichinella spiralis]
MGYRQPISDETMVLSESKDTDIGNVVSETDNSVDEGKAVAWITWINDISVFLSKNDSSMAIGNIVQNDRGIGIQRLRSLDRYTPNMECRTVAYTTKTLHGSSATRNVRRETLPRTATAKTAVERLRQEAEEPSTSTSTDTDRSGKKSPM